MWIRMIAHHEQRRCYSSQMYRLENLWQHSANRIRVFRLSQSLFGVVRDGRSDLVKNLSISFLLKI